MEYSGYTPPVQQLLGMFHTQSFLSTPHQLHPAFMQHHSREAEHLLQQRLLAVCAGATNGISGGTNSNLFGTSGPVTGTTSGLIESRLFQNRNINGSKMSPKKESDDSIGSDNGKSGKFTIDAILGNKENTTNVISPSSSSSSSSSLAQLNSRGENSPEKALETAGGNCHQNRIIAPNARSATSIGDATTALLASTYGSFSRLTGGKLVPHSLFEDGGSARKPQHHQHNSRTHLSNGIHTVSKPYECRDFAMSHYQEHRNLGKNKRVRTIFTPEQLERLEAVFRKQQYMVGTERYYLAASLNLSEAQVKVWFQNRRIKWRKHQFEEQHQRLQSKPPGLDSDSDIDDNSTHDQDCSIEESVEINEDMIRTGMPQVTVGKYELYGMSGIERMRPGESDLPGAYFSNMSNPDTRIQINEEYENEDPQRQTCMGGFDSDNQIKQQRTTPDTAPKKITESPYEVNVNNGCEGIDKPEMNDDEIVYVNDVKNGSDDQDMASSSPVQVSSLEL